MISKYKQASERRRRFKRVLFATVVAISALVLGVWSVAELLGHSPLGLEFADARAGGPFGQPAYLGAACLLVGPLAAAGGFVYGRLSFAADAASSSNRA